ncbi:MAG: VOC family protein [Thermosynechococcaceae cyanobacterium]
MNLRYAYTRLNVENYAACKQFYQDVLGFKIAFEDDLMEYAELETGDTKITILNRARLKEYIGKTEVVTYDPHTAKVALTFIVNDLEAAIEDLKTKGVTLVNPLYNYPGQGFMAACFRDPDGNLIELEQFLT